MCGIAAIFSRQAPIAPATIERATRSLYHRGPDGQRHGISADLLDRLDTMDESARVANDQILMILVSACVLQERFGLGA